MLLAILWLVGTIVLWWFLGWKFGAAALFGYVMALVGANSPHTFITSKHWLESVGSRVLDKTMELKAKL